MTATSTYPFAQDINGEDLSFLRFLSGVQQQEQLRFRSPSTSYSYSTASNISSLTESPMNATSPVDSLTAATIILKSAAVQQTASMDVKNLKSMSLNMMEQSQAPDCLVILQIATAGKQGIDLGSDESSIVLISAKLFNISNRNLEGPEFQIRVKHQLADVESSVDYDDLPEELNSEGDWPKNLGCPQTSTAKQYHPSCITPVISWSEESQLFTGLTSADLVNAASIPEALQELDNWLMGLGLYYMSDFSESYHEAWIEPHTLERMGQSLDDEEDEEADVYRSNSSIASNIVSSSGEIQKRKQRFEVVVDGVSGLRLVLHQAMTDPVVRTSTLYPYLYRYIDIKKQYQLLYPHSQSSLSLSDMMKELHLGEPEFPPGYIPEAATWSTSWMSDVLRNSQVQQTQQQHNEMCIPDLQKHSESPKASPDDGTSRMKQKGIGFWPISYCRNVALLCNKMTSDGCKWKVYEVINSYYQPTYVRMSEQVEDDVVIRARGLPWQATDFDIQYFFRGLNIAPGGIALVLSKAGRRNGEAVIRFTDREQRDLALRKHKHHMKQRYIEIYAGQGADFIAVAGGETEEAETFLKKLTDPSQTLVRLRGLPYSATAEEILEFFAKVNSSVQFGKQGVLFVNRRDGRSTGDAFALFQNDAEAQRALNNHRQHIGNRYIELFRSTPAEINQVMNAVMNPLLTIQPNTINKGILDPESTLQFFTLMSTPTEAVNKGQFMQSGLYFPPANGPLSSMVNFNSVLQSPFLRPPCLPLFNPLGPKFNSTGQMQQLLNQQPQLAGMNEDILLKLGMNPIVHKPPRNMIRIKGMPLGATINDILNFLGVYWQLVALHGIHLIYTTNGEPSGEAFVRFVSDTAANLVILGKQGHTFMGSNGSCAFVELIQTTQNETNDFVSIPGLQPVINWQTLPTTSPITTITGGLNQSAMLNVQAAATCVCPQSNPVHPIMLSMRLPINSQQPPTFPPTTSTGKPAGGGLQITNPVTGLTISATKMVDSTPGVNDTCA